MSAPPTHLRTSAVAKRLRISRARVTQLVAEGRLHRVRGPDGAPLYAEEEVRKFAESYKPRRSQRRASTTTTAEVSGETCKRVFELLTLRTSLPAIVVECAIHPAIVRELRREFLTSFEEHDRQRAYARAEAAENAAQREHDRGMARDDAHRRRLEIARIAHRRAEPEPKPPTPSKPLRSE